MEHPHSINRLIHGALNFNKNIGSWKLSKVTNMSGMFSRATLFNNDNRSSIGSWDVSNVNNMSDMFSGAYSFNQDISKWNVSNVTNMKHMFYRVELFNHDISKWNVSNVTNMEAMFCLALSFNQNIGLWNVSNVMNMKFMFDCARSFKINIGKWPINSKCSISCIFDNEYPKEILNGKLYGNKIAKYFNLDNPNEDKVWEPYTRWERRKNAVMFFSSISKMNITDSDSEEIKSNDILNILHSMDDNIYKEIVMFI